MSGVTVKVDARKWSEALKRAPGVFRVASRAALQVVGKTVAGEISKQGMRGRPGLKRRTGTLARSLTTLPASDGKTERLWVGFVLPGARYAGIHETGGVIRAGSKLLAIPVGPALTPAGVPRFPGPRSVQGLVFRRAKGGGLLGKVTGKGGREKFTVWYVLKKEVRIPPRLGFFKTWRAFFAGPKPKAIIQREVNKAVRAINGVP